MPRFIEGDRVQVADTWFVEDVRGLCGTIAAYPMEASHRNSNAVWIEFDSVWPPDSPLQRVAAAEVAEEHLILLKRSA
ncbi:MAG TPA: hypothetical protein PKC18_20195 [Lacipirellulaceae bacterium]|nr:hypothetical protein [Lacipirellulaceae bacterium]